MPSQPTGRDTPSENHAKERQTRVRRDEFEVGVFIGWVETNFDGVREAEECLAASWLGNKCDHNE